MKSTKEALEGIIDAVRANRNTGNTRALVGVTAINPKAVIVCGSMATRQQLCNNYRVSPNQIAGVFSLESLEGRDSVLLFDASTVDIVVHRSLDEINRLEDKIKDMKEKLELHGIHYSD